MSNLLVQNIKHTNGTTAQTIDSSGRVLHSVKPSFMAIGYQSETSDFTTGSESATVNGVTPTGNNLIYNYRTIVQNTGNHFNNSSGRFTCPVAGLYLVTAHVGYKDGTNYTGLGMFATPNDSAVLGHVFAWSQNSPNHDCLTLTAHVVASVGQQFLLVLRGDYSHPSSSAADQHYFHFGASFLG
jgi:hypothetical protein